LAAKVTLYAKNRLFLIEKIPLMFRRLLLFVFLLSAFLADAQRRSLPENFKRLAFSPDNAWQSKYLFDYDVRFYGLHLNISPDTSFISGHVRINAVNLADNLDTFAVELIPQMLIDSAFFEKTKLKAPKRSADNVLFRIPEISKKGTLFSVTIYYHGTSPTGGFFSGVSVGYNKTWKKQVAWTLSEPFAAKSWFPVKQDLKDKADSAWIFLTVDKHYMAGSEGLLTRISDLGNGKRRFEWKTRYPIDYYLISYAVADYRDFSFYVHPDPDKQDSLLVQNYIYNSDDYLRLNRKAIERTGKFIALYSRLFGSYPFRKEKYGHCLTELHGGMEHQTMTTIGGFGFDLMAHELGHMWFGDNVTCADWSDIWVNEGFATYADYLANEYVNGDSAARLFMAHAHKNAMSQPGGSVFVPLDEVFQGNEWRIFNGRLSYDKGAAIIHMLRHEIQNDSVFFRILKTYQKKFAGRTATGKDFASVVDSVTGDNYSWFFDQWYYGEGYPVFDIDWYQKADSVFLFSTETTSTQTVTFFRILQDFRMVFSDGSDTVVRFQQTKNQNRFVVVLPEDKKQIVSLKVDPNEYNLQKINKVEYVSVHVNQNPAAFSMGPIPAHQTLWLQFYHVSAEPVRVEVFDVSGRKVMASVVTGSKIKMDVSGLKPGVYIIRATLHGRLFVRKFIH
jgi:aminopeptidase N